jgi:hypothetical protein
MPITITFMTDASETAEHRWRPYDDWPDSDVRPQKGELVKLGSGPEMRVLEVISTGPTAMDVYLIPTYGELPTAL